MNLKDYRITQRGASFADCSGDEWNVKSITNYDGLNIYIGRTRLVLGADVARADVVAALREYAQAFENFAADIEKGR